MSSAEEKKKMEDPKRKKALSLPSNYVTLQQLQEQRLKEQQKREEEEEKERQLQKQTEEEERERQLQKQIEEEERERQLLKQIEAAAAAKEGEKQLETLGSKSRVSGKNNGQEPTIETKKKKRSKQKLRPKKNQTLDGGVKESKGSEGCKTTEIPLLTAAISQKIEVLRVSDCEKKGELEMNGVDRSDEKSTVEKKGDSQRGKGFKWRRRPLRGREKINGSDEPLERSTTGMRRGSPGARAVPVRDLWVVESGKLLKINGSDRVGERSSSENGADCEKRGEMEGSNGLGGKSTAENGVTRDCEKMVQMDAGAVETSKSEGRGSFRRRAVGRRENPVRRMPATYWGKRWEMKGSDGVERRSTAEKRRSFLRERGMEGRFPGVLMWVKKDVASDGVSHLGPH